MWDKDVVLWSKHKEAILYNVLLGKKDKISYVTFTKHVY